MPGRPERSRPAKTLTWPEGIGRERVRSTLRSRSRSTMSFQVQPAPRIANAPMKNSTRWSRLGDRLCGGDRGERRRPPAGQQQQPRADRAVEPGQPQIGTRPGWCEGVDPIAGRVGDRTGRRAHFANGLPFSESRVPRPVLVLLPSIDRRRADRITERRRPRLGGGSFACTPWCGISRSVRDWSWPP